MVGSTPEFQLELERLRAERDALAAELQIERAERLRTEERLHLFEREKLELMREGAASREKLASELEEARLRAMRAEARQAALDADVRLSEIAERRRGLAGSEPDRDEGAGEIAEPEAGEPAAPDEAEAGSQPEESRPRAAGQSAPAGGANGAKYNRTSRGAAAGNREPARPPQSTRSARDDASGARERPAREAVRSERPSAEPDAGSSGGRLRMSDVPEPRWPSQGAASSRPGASAGPRAAEGAKGGAAAGRPSIDRASLEVRLAAGQIIETTERFRQFEPVAQAHIKICDWLQRAHTLDEIDALAGGEIARSEIVSILTLFFERSFLVFK